jgi:hypothetical protein
MQSCYLANEQCWHNIWFIFLVLDQGTSYRRSCCRKVEKGSFDWKSEWLLPFLIVKRVWKATNTPSKPTIYPKTSNKNFEIAILFNVVENSVNLVFKDDNPPQSPQGKGYKLYARGIKGFYWKLCRRNMKKNAFNWKFKRLVPF